MQNELFNFDGTPAYGAMPLDVSEQCSREAYDKVDTEKIERLAEQEFLLYPNGATADEIAYRLQGMGLVVDEMSVRPRVSALKDRKVLFTTGERRKNRKGNSCAVLVHRNLIQEGT